MGAKRLRRYGSCDHVAIVACAWAASAAWGQPVAVVPEGVHFSTELSFLATGGPHAGSTISDGAELNAQGIVVNSNFDLTAAFCPMPPVADYGLDGLHRGPLDRVFFSTESGWFDQCLNRPISGGDLLATDGSVVRTNAQLMSNFNPKPVVPDVGLDAVHLVTNNEIWFSIEEDIFDEILGVLLKHGDLLSDTGAVVRTNEQLISGFCPMPPVGDMGLDAVFLRSGGEIWFSTEESWFDECLGVSVGAGDLLSDAGHVVARNAELIAGFIGPVHPSTIGLDAVWIRAGERFVGCGTLIEGVTIDCVLFAADEGGFYLIDDLGGFGPGDRVWVEGVLDRSCALFCGQQDGCIRNNTISRCFQGCGELQFGPQGCVVLATDDDVLFIDNVDGFEPGDRVWVKGCLNPESLICPPFTAPAIENNEIFRCFEGCGELAVGPQGCPIVQTGTTFYFIENIGDFQFGDRVWVRGCLNPDSFICGPFNAPGIEDNTIGNCFDGCGTLAHGPQGCLLFVSGDEAYFMENTGAFRVGDSFRAIGCLNPESQLCHPILAPGIEDNRVVPLRTCNPPSEATCPRADVDCNHVVNGLDIAAISSSANFGKHICDAQRPNADVDGNGIVNGLDIAIASSSACFGM